MNKKLSVLAFDLGASSGRAMIGELNDLDGKPVLSVREIHRFSNDPVQVGGHLHWDILRLLHEIKTGIRKAHREGVELLSFGIDSWGVDFGLLDKNGELLANPYHYRDPYTVGIMEELFESIGKERLFAEGGLQFLNFNSIYQLYAMKKMGKSALAQAETFLMIPDLLLYFLTGEKVSEFTNASTTQMVHPQTREWNVKLLQELGLPTHILLPLVQPGTIVGKLSASVCDELGVPAIPAVAVATHDTASAVAAVPASKSPFAYLSCGTWSLLGTELKAPVTTAQAMEWNFTNEGGVDGTYRVLKNIMGLWLLQECKRTWDANGEVHSFSELVELAQQAPAFASFIDPDDDRFMQPLHMPDKIREYCRETGQKVPETVGEITRCILESLACRYRETLERAEQLAGATFDGLHMVGGGINNRLLCQMTANAIQRPVWAGPVEGSAIGNMIMQFRAHGAFASLLEAREAIGRSFPYETYLPQDAEQWQNAFARFKEITRKRP